MEDEIIVEADFTFIENSCFEIKKHDVDWFWFTLIHFGLKLIEFAEFFLFQSLFVRKERKMTIFYSGWQITIIVEDQIRPWRLYFCPQINRRGDTAIRYFRVHLVFLLIEDFFKDVGRNQRVGSYHLITKQGQDYRNEKIACFHILCC